MTFSPPRSPGYRPYFFVFCLFALVWIVALLFAGGFTTSIRAGMAFLDWPLSNGSINPEGWMADPDMRAEHSHRILGMKIGLLSILCATWLWFKEPRQWVRNLGYVLLAMVVIQGLMGGARVMLDTLNTGWDSNIVAQSFAVAHACGAQLVLLALTTITLASSPLWHRNAAAATPLPTSPPRTLGLVTCAAVFLQILLGAIMRHSNAGLAIPTFPLTPDGGLLPTLWSYPVTIHFAHRAGAIVVTVLLVAYCLRLWSLRHTVASYRLGVFALTGLLGIQLVLGALTIWTTKNPHAATLHMLFGAFLLASTWALTLLNCQHSAAAQVPTPHPIQPSNRPAETLESKAASI